jgi:hydroxymethylpyrimidine/phosphomethylpyrimidine kinase
MVATSGAALLDPRALAAVREKLLPVARLVTPNLDEVAVLLGEKPATATAMVAAARTLAGTYGVAFLVKGGHLSGDELTDVLANPTGETRIYTSRRVHGVNTHGSGCTLSAAIAANLARSLTMEAAVDAARSYLLRALECNLVVGGRRFINHRP